MSAGLYWALLSSINCEYRTVEIIFDLHHYECIALPVANSLQNGQFWVRLTTSVHDSVQSGQFWVRSTASVHDSWQPPEWSILGQVNCFSPWQPPEWSVLGQVNCFSPWQPVGVEVVMHCLHPNSCRHDNLLAVGRILPLRCIPVILLLHNCQK